MAKKISLRRKMQNHPFFVLLQPGQCDRWAVVIFSEYLRVSSGGDKTEVVVV